MMIANILAVANNSGGWVTLELCSGKDCTEIAELPAGINTLARSLEIPEVLPGQSPASNYLLLTCRVGQIQEQVCLWRNAVKIYVHHTPEWGGAGPLGYTSANPDDPEGIRLIVNAPGLAGGGWVIGDIIGARS